jgi:hypothetical protein
MSFITFTNCNEDSLCGKAKKVYRVLRKRIDQILLEFSYDAQINLSITAFKNFFRFELIINLHTSQLPGEYRSVCFFNTLKNLFSDCVKFNVEYDYGYQLITVSPKSKNTTHVSMSVSGTSFQDVNFHLIYDC